MAEGDSNVVSDADFTAEDEQEIAAARSELEDLRAKLRARTAQLKAEAQARQAGRAVEQENDAEALISGESVDVEPEPVDNAEVELASTGHSENVPDEEAEMMAAWEAELEGNRTEPSADDERRDVSDTSLEPEKAELPEQALDETQPEAAMMAEWEARIADDMAVEEEEPSTEDSVEGLSADRAVEIDEQERAEQEAEAELAAAWQQAEETPSFIEPVEPVEPVELDELDELDEAAEARDEHEEIDTGPAVTLTDAKTALSEMWDDLTEEPLPSDEDLDAMFEEIRQLDKQNSVDEEESEMTYKPTKRGDLHSILSSIPSFSDMNKKPDK
jgi:hypothetical protein